MFIINILLTALAFFIVSKILPGFRIKSFGTAVIASILLAVVGYVMLIFVPIFALPFLAMLGVSAMFGPLGLLAFGAVFAITAQAIMLILVDWVGSSRVDLQACKLEYSIVSPK